MKAALVSAVIEGRAVAADGAATSDVLSELRQLVNRVSLDDQAPVTDAAADQLLDQALRLYRSEQDPSGQPRTSSPAARPADSALRLEAINALARAMTRPNTRRFQVPASRAGTTYTLDVDGTDVTCSCRGFEYRGQCKHARQLKEVLTTGGPLPQGFQEVSVP